MKKRILAFAICLGLLTGIFTACGKAESGEETATTPAVTTKTVQTTAATNTTTTETIPETTVPVETTSGDDTDADFNFPEEGKRPYAVMIDNEGTRPLPQGGLDKAQVIYEIIVEYGATRIMPLFWNEKPEMIGPVRSARHYFIEYAMEHDSLYVHIGYSPKAERYIIDHKIQNANGVKNGSWIFWDITSDRKNYQDSYTSMAKIMQYMSGVKYRTTTDKPLVFSYNKTDAELEVNSKSESASNSKSESTSNSKSESASNSKSESASNSKSVITASEISIKYSYYKCSYSFNSETRKYDRFREGKPHMERNSGEQLSAKNIIIQYVKNYRIKGDTADRQELDNVGEGKGYFITLGKAVEITWNKSDIFEPTVYKDMSGSTIKLNPGQTWIQVVPLDSGITIK